MAPIRRLFRQSTSYLARKICRPQTVTVNETEIVILSPPNFLCYFYIPGFPPAKNSRTTKNHNQSGPHSPPLSYSSCAIAAPLLGALAATAALPAVASRRRVRGTSPSPAGRPCDDGSIAAPMSGSRARAASRRAPVTPRALRRPASR